MPMHISRMSASLQSGDFIHVKTKKKNEDIDEFFIPVLAAREFALTLEKMTRPPEYPRYYSEFEVDLLLKEKHLRIDELNRNLNEMDKENNALIDELNKALTKSLPSIELPKPKSKKKKETQVTCD